MTIYENLEYCRKNKGLEVFAYVIMTNHIHLIARHKEGKLNECLRDYKSYTAKKLLSAIEENPNESRKEWMIYMFRYFANNTKQNKDLMFWNKTIHPIELTDAHIFEQKREYIHFNPLKAGIVTDETCYFHISANPNRRLQVDES